MLLESQGCFYICKVIDYTSPDNPPIKFTFAELQIFRLFLQRQYNIITNTNNLRLGTAFRVINCKQSPALTHIGCLWIWHLIACC